MANPLSSEEILENINALNGLQVIYKLSGQEEFNDAIFKKDYVDKKKLAERIPLPQTILYCKEFLNWYVSGKNADNITSAWIGVVCAMRVPRTDDVFETLLAESTFTGKVDGDETIKLKPPQNVEKLTEIDFAKYDNEKYKVKDAEIMDWYDFLYEIFERDDSYADKNYETAEKTVLIAIDYVGYIALCLINAVKHCFKLSWHFVNKVTNEFNQFWHASSTIKMRTPPPHQDVIEKFSHEEFVVDNMILILGTYAFTESPNRGVIQKILEKACLDNVEFWGMGCLYWLIKAEKPCGASAEVILHHFGRESATTLELRNMLVNFVNKSKNELTWRWSRLICPKAFLGLSTSKDPLLAATLAALTYKCDMEKPIWNNIYFSSNEIKTKAERKAKRMLRNIKKFQKKK